METSKERLLEKLGWWSRRRSEGVVKRVFSRRRHGRFRRRSIPSITAPKLCESPPGQPCLAIARVAIPRRMHILNILVNTSIETRPVGPSDRRMAMANDEALLKLDVVVTAGQEKQCLFLKQTLLSYMQRLERGVSGFRTNEKTVNAGDTGMHSYKPLSSHDLRTRNRRRVY